MTFTSLKPCEFKLVCLMLRALRWVWKSDGRCKPKPFSFCVKQTKKITNTTTAYDSHYLARSIVYIFRVSGIKNKTVPPKYLEIKCTWNFQSRFKTIKMPNERREVVRIHPRILYLSTPPHNPLHRLHNDRIVQPADLPGREFTYPSRK